MTKIVWKHLIGRYSCILAESLHLCPIVTAVQCLSIFRDENHNADYTLLLCILKQFFAQRTDDKHPTCFSLAWYNRFTSMYRFYRNILDLADTNTGTANRLNRKRQAFIPLALRSSDKGQILRFGKFLFFWAKHLLLNFELFYLAVNPTSKAQKRI